MRYLKKLDPVVQRVAGWATFGGLLLSCFYSVLAILSPLFEGRHWTEIILLSIAMALATLLAFALIAAVGASAYRRFRSFPVPHDRTLADELDRTKTRLMRAEERLDGSKVEPATGGRSPRKQPRLTDAERERLSRALIALSDYLEGDFEEYIAPIREVRTWPSILRTVGPAGVQEKAELARVRVRELPQTMSGALKRYLDDLELVGIHPIAIKTKAIPFEDSLHSIASVAYAMRPDHPNQAALSLPGNVFSQAFDKFQEELDRVKGQVRETRRNLANGDL